MNATTNSAINHKTNLRIEYLLIFLMCATAWFIQRSDAIFYSPPQAGLILFFLRQFHFLGLENNRHPNWNVDKKNRHILQ